MWHVGFLNLKGNITWCTLNEISGLMKTLILSMCGRFGIKEWEGQRCTWVLSTACGRWWFTPPFHPPSLPLFYHNGNLLTFGQPPLSMDNICEHLAPDDPEPFVHLGLWSLGPLRFSISDAIWFDRDRHRNLHPPPVPQPHPGTQWWWHVDHFGHTLRERGGDPERLLYHITMLWKHSLFEQCLQNVADHQQFIVPFRTTLVARTEGRHTFTYRYSTSGSEIIGVVTPRMAWAGQTSPIGNGLPCYS